MNDQDCIVIQGISFNGYCGVTSEERTQPQSIIVDLEIHCATRDAILYDDISMTVDYAKVTDSVVQLGTTQQFSLIETMADQVCQILLAQFPIVRIKIVARKVNPSLLAVEGSVGVQLERRNDHVAYSSAVLHKPARFLVDQQSRLPNGLVLDVATGHGRNAVYLASKGFTVEGIDHDAHALASLKTMAQHHRLSLLTVQSIDLEKDSEHPPDLGINRYDVILVFFYLHRPLFPYLIKALKPGGVLMCETFLVDNHVRYQHPQRKAFCLNHSELLHLTRGLRVLHYDEGTRCESHQDAPTFTARLLAEKPTSSPLPEEPTLA